ncbi:hypothetical protein PF008_g4814 [Phytophthora fragariae]|uniref:Uncharacterized protein n=1 Tax=Phytophthora fragariae TaxID=53985 RepID=A0A6G0SBW7_9STRA|nr:hypothetical protein PF008_g4814 [Phytophthora fragariae]
MTLQRRLGYAEGSLKSLQRLQGVGEEAPPPKRKGVRRSRRVVPRVVSYSSTRGNIRVFAVDPAIRGATLRNFIVAQLKLTARLSAIRLVVLKRNDNTWADQADAVRVREAVMWYPLHIAGMLPELTASSDMIHVRVEVASKLRSESADENNSLAEEAVGIVNDNYMSTEAYFQVEEELPPEAIKEIEHEYLKNVKARGPPWHLSEADRRPFIASIWQACTSAAKDKMKHEI